MFYKPSIRCSNLLQHNMHPPCALHHKILMAYYIFPISTQPRTPFCLYFYCFVQGIQMTTRKRMCDIKGISEAKMEKIKEAAAKLEVSQPRNPRLWFFSLNSQCHCLVFMCSLDVSKKVQAKNMLKKRGNSLVLFLMQIVNEMTFDQ